MVEGQRVVSVRELAPQKFLSRVLCGAFLFCGRGFVPRTFLVSFPKSDHFSALLLQNPAAPPPLRKSVNTYVHLAGIESGYGFFAPNVPGTCKLVFELHYPDGRTESRVPEVSSNASGLRVATLLDKIGRPQYDPLREVIIKMLASAIWREHSDATMIRAIFGVVTLPSADEFEHGIRESNEFLYSYDFAFQPAEPNRRNP